MNRSENTQRRKTLSGLPVDPLYLPADQSGSYEEKLGMPGEYPFTRGVYSTMYHAQAY